MRRGQSRGGWKASHVLVIALSLFVAGPLGLLLTALFFVFRNGEAAASTNPIEVVDSRQDTREMFGGWRDNFDQDTEEYLLNRDHEDLLEIITRLRDEDDAQSISRS